MLDYFELFSLALLLALAPAYALPQPRASRSGGCTPFHTTFSDLASSHFLPISDHETFEVSPTGLSMYLDRPKGGIQKIHDGKLNDKIADGATMNSTFFMHYGKLTVEISAPPVAGVVTAAILIADQMDEIDIELLGGTPTHWDSNIFAPAPGETEPLYGVFNVKQRFPQSKSGTTSEMHTYTVEWSQDKIAWGVDGDVVRVLERQDTFVDGAYHFPSHPARIQLGIWDASGAVGTAHWAKGPIDWDRVEGRIKAQVKSVKVECH